MTKLQYGRKVTEKSKFWLLLLLLLLLWILLLWILLLWILLLPPDTIDYSQLSRNMAEKVMNNPNSNYYWYGGKYQIDCQALLRYAKLWQNWYVLPGLEMR